MDFLNQCTALITGASSGLGAEFARQLAPVAKTLILVARRTDRLEALAAELARHGLTIHCRSTDLADKAQLDELIAWLKALDEPVDFLVNNAGLGDHGRFESSDWERVRCMLDVNIGALTRLTHALLPILKAQPRAAILNVSSAAAFVPVPKLGVYAATKAYVSSFTESLRAELRGTRVRVTAVCPGPVPTEFGQAAQRPVDSDPQTTPAFAKTSAQRVVLEALRAVETDRPRVFPGWLTPIVILLIALTPMFILRVLLNRRGR